MNRNQKPIETRLKVILSVTVQLTDSPMDIFWGVFLPKSVWLSFMVLVRQLTRTSSSGAMWATSSIQVLVGP